MHATPDDIARRAASEPNSVVLGWDYSACRRTPMRLLAPALREARARFEELAQRHPHASDESLRSMVIASGEDTPVGNGSAPARSTTGRSPDPLAATAANTPSTGKGGEEREPVLQLSEIPEREGTPSVRQVSATHPRLFSRLTRRDATPDEVDAIWSCIAMRSMVERGMLSEAQGLSSLHSLVRAATAPSHRGQPPAAATKHGTLLAEAGERGLPVLPLSHVPGLDRSAGSGSNPRREKPLTGSQRRRLKRAGRMPGADGLL